MLALEGHTLSSASQVGDKIDEDLQLREFLAASTDRRLVRTAFQEIRFTDCKSELEVVPTMQP